jgi:hypothetical protein
MDQNGANHLISIDKIGVAINTIWFDTKCSCVNYYNA